MAKILVIDDDEQIQHLLKRILEGLDHFVVTAENGAVGLKVLSQEAFDLVITDIFMPEKEGLETIMDIKRQFPDVKIAAISGGDSNGCDYLHMTKSLGADGCLHKPFDRNELTELVQGLLS